MPVVLALVCGTSSAQTSLRAEKITAPIKHRGTYHVATGTWSRAQPTSSFNDIVIFNNTAPSGYVFMTTADFNTVDHGRIPSTSSPSSPTSVTGNSDGYFVVCFELSYCSSIPTAAGGVDIALSFYEGYGPCTDVDATGSVDLEASFISSGLPGGTPTSGQGCWTVSFDLSNTTNTFVLRGDADGTWDDVLNMDAFGWGLQFTNASFANDTGPVIAGKCPAGGISGNPVVPPHGYGTTFESPDAVDVTGLGTNDYFWVDSALLGSSASPNGGCFFFGGCTDPSIMGSATNPFGGFYLRLFGDRPDVIPPIGTSYCTSLANATGSPAILSAIGFDANSFMVFKSSPVPNTTGQFFFGPMMLLGTQTLGDGLRCVGGMTMRMLPFITAGMMGQPDQTVYFTVNYNAPYAAAFSGTRHFQHWFREPSGTSVTGSNTSTAVSIEF